MKVNAAALMVKPESTLAIGRHIERLPDRLPNHSHGQAGGCVDRSVGGASWYADVNSPPPLGRPRLATAAFTSRARLETNVPDRDDGVDVASRGQCLRVDSPSRADAAIRGPAGQVAR